MKNFNLLFFTLFSIVVNMTAQVGIGTTSPNTSALLDVSAIDKGILIPRVALLQTTNFAPLLAHVAGMQVYNTATAGDVIPGQYYNDGAKWVRVGDALASKKNYTFLRSSDNLPAENVGDQLITAYRIGNTGFKTATPTTTLQIGNDHGNPGGALQINLDDTDPQIQGLKSSVKRTTGDNYAVNGTAFGAGATTNIGLYGYALNATNNFGLFVESGKTFLVDQTKIGGLFSSSTPNAILEVEATNKGILIPRLTTAQRIAIVSPTGSLMVYDVDVDLFYFYSIANGAWSPINTGSIKSIATTSYTLLPSDSGRILEFSAATTVALTVPSGLPIGFQVSISQVNVGIITFAGAGGMVINNRWAATATSGQWAKAGIEVRATNSCILSGDVQ